MSVSPTLTLADITAAITSINAKIDNVDGVNDTALLAIKTELLSTISDAITAIKNKIDTKDSKFTDIITAITAITTKVDELKTSIISKIDTKDSKFADIITAINTKVAELKTEINSKFPLLEAAINAKIDAVDADNDIVMDLIKSKLENQDRTRILGARFAGKIVTAINTIALSAGPRSKTGGSVLAAFGMTPKAATFLIRTKKQGSATWGPILRLAIPDVEKLEKDDVISQPVEVLQGFEAQITVEYVTIAGGVVTAAKTSSLVVLPLILAGTLKVSALSPDDLSFKTNKLQVLVTRSDPRPGIYKVIFNYINKNGDGSAQTAVLDMQDDNPLTELTVSDTTATYSVCAAEVSPDDVLGDFCDSADISVDGAYSYVSPAFAFQGRDDTGSSLLDIPSDDTVRCLFLASSVLGFKGTIEFKPVTTPVTSFSLSISSDDLVYGTDKLAGYKIATFTSERLRGAKFSRAEITFVNITKNGTKIVNSGSKGFFDFGRLINLSTPAVIKTVTGRFRTAYDGPDADTVLAYFGGSDVSLFEVAVNGTTSKLISSGVGGATVSFHLDGDNDAAGTPVYNLANLSNVSESYFSVTTTGTSFLAKIICKLSVIQSLFASQSQYQPKLTSGAPFYVKVALADTDGIVCLAKTSPLINWVSPPPAFGTLSVGPSILPGYYRFGVQPDAMYVSESWNIVYDIIVKDGNNQTVPFDAFPGAAFTTTEVAQKFVDVAKSKLPARFNVAVRAVKDNKKSPTAFSALTTLSGKAPAVNVSITQLDKDAQLNWGTVSPTLMEGKADPEFKIQMRALLFKNTADFNKWKSGDFVDLEFTSNLLTLAQDEKKPTQSFKVSSIPGLASKLTAGRHLYAALACTDSNGEGTESQVNTSIASKPTVSLIATRNPKTGTTNFKFNVDEQNATVPVWNMVSYNALGELKIFNFVITRIQHIAEYFGDFAKWDYHVEATGATASLVKNIDFTSSSESWIAGQLGFNISSQDDDLFDAALASNVGGSAAVVVGSTSAALQLQQANKTA